MKRSKALKIISTALAMFLFAGIFFELGLWQWHRAQATSREGKIIPDQTPVPLTAVDVAGKNIYSDAINRIVTFQGQYVQDFVAPGQFVQGDGYKDLDVGLLLMSGNRAILVVRGLHDGSIQPISAPVNVEGRLYPSQQEDHGITNATNLGRLDPALIAGDHHSLFDGYVIATKESLASDPTHMNVPADRVPAPIIIASISGFYWQHISYVVIWWFMGLLVLAAPYISKRNERAHALADHALADQALTEQALADQGMRANGEATQ